MSESLLNKASAYACARLDALGIIISPGPSYDVNEALAESRCSMKLNQFAISCLLVVLAHCAGNAQEFPPSAARNSALEDRLRNAQVTKITMSNGAVLREVRFAGSLQPNFDLGCVAISEVNSQFNPPALIYAARKCILQEQYAQAWALLTTGNGFAYYDLKRLADRSTQGAKTVLTMNAFADLTDVQREKVTKIFKDLQTDPEIVKAYCTELTRIGPPTYEPQWAILHGIGAFQEPRIGPYLTNVDTKSLWDEALKNRCTPQMP
jgi:hypothetical protein